MKFCTSCGANLEEDYKFCFECGHPVKSDQPGEKTISNQEEGDEALDLDAIISTLESTGNAEDKELSALIAEINKPDETRAENEEAKEASIESIEKIDLNKNERESKSDAHVIKEARGVSDKEAERVKRRRELLGSNESEITKSIVLEDEEKPKQQVSKSIKWIQGILIAIIVLIILLVGYLYLKNYYGIADSLVIEEVVLDFTSQSLATISSNN